MLYDVLIIGAATSGACFARRIAEKGYKVKVIEKLSQTTLGKRLDIFHIGRNEIIKYGLPMPQKGDNIWAFDFEGTFCSSPYDTVKIPQKQDVIGMHMPEYIHLLNRWAEEVGAEFEYEASFSDFLYDETGKVAGAKYVTPKGEKEVKARVVVDCSGVNAVGRRKIKDDVIEKFELTANDKFYVVIKYIRFVNEKYGYNGWPSHKAWIAPEADPERLILGAGACGSYEVAEKMLADLLTKVKLPEFTVERVERGTTPYSRVPYSLVTDNFIISGDSCCLTKPNNGEGVASSMPEILIAVDVLDKALKNNDVSKKALWEINTRYNKEQGADFASTRAILTKATKATLDEFEFFFANGIIFNEKFLDSTTNGPEIKVSVNDILQIFGGIIKGLFSGEISFNTIKNIIDGLSLGGKLKKLYLDFPKSPDGYKKWTKKADAIWNKVGKME